MRTTTDSIPTPTSTPTPSGVVVTGIKFSKRQRGYVITAKAKHETLPLSVDYSVWATSLHQDSIRHARDEATAGALAAIEALA